MLKLHQMVMPCKVHTQLLPYTVQLSNDHMDTAFHCLFVTYSSLLCHHKKFLIFHDTGNIKHACYMRGSCVLHAELIRATCGGYACYMQSACELHVGAMRATCRGHACYMQGPCVFHAEVIRATGAVHALCLLEIAIAF